MPFCYRCGNKLEDGEVCPKCGFQPNQHELMINAKIALYQDLRDEIKRSTDLRIQYLGFLVALDSGLVTAGLTFDKAAFLIIPIATAFFGWLILFAYRTFFMMAAVVRSVCDIGWEQYARAYTYKKWPMHMLVLLAITPLTIALAPYGFYISQQKTTLSILNNVTPLVLYVCVAIPALTVWFTQYKYLLDSICWFSYKLSESEVNLFDQYLRSFLGRDQNTKEEQVFGRDQGKVREV